jgi:N-methylhydantoinase A
VICDWVINKNQSQITQSPNHLITKYMKLGIDIGGTFTDLVLMDDTTGKLNFAKTLTTYPDPAVGIMNGVQEILSNFEIKIEDIDTLVHGTTLVTNAIIERKGAKTGLITTQGFEDVLEIGREMRYDIYDLFITLPPPIVPQNLRIGVKERLDKNGNIVTKLSTKSLKSALERLNTEGVESVGVCLLHSFANPKHEQMIGNFIKKNYPNLYYSLSSDVMPEIREYERTSATVMNAYVLPITDEYLKRIKKQLENIGFQGIINIMISSGRLTTIDGARKTPIQLLESGPAGGSMASVFFGKLTGLSHLLAFDMGGTTAKASIIHDYKPEITNHFEAGRVHRFKKGSGLPVRIPVIDMIEIGAGGGSIARINHIGLLTVGPDSAASQPGPACYGRGGDMPTVTDADLVLGYLNADYFLGGTMKLDIEAARKVIKKHLADPLSQLRISDLGFRHDTSEIPNLKPEIVTIEEAALGVYRIVNENMANAARVHILEKGLDPRHYSMIAFGGAGPVHAFNVARLIGCPKMLIPVGAGVASALGFLVSPVASEEMTSYITHLNSANWQHINHFLSEMEAKGFDFLTRAYIPRSEATVTRVADMRYAGQGHEITVTIPNGILSEESVVEIERRFKTEYELRYQRSIENVPMEAVTWRVVVSGKSPEIEPSQSVQNRGTEFFKGRRQVWFPNQKTAIDTPVYDRYALPVGQVFEGPAIIEEMESTTVVGLDSTFLVDVHRNILVTLH